MKAQALPKYQIPQYPSKLQVQEQPQLLRRCVSTRWQKLIDAGLSGALLAGISLTGCQEESIQNPALTGSGQIGAIQNPDGTTTTTGTQVKKVIALVAPIFEHGEGRGVTGCVAAAPPVFLSEDEALVVIKEELAKYGIKFDKEKIVINEVMITPGTYENAKDMNIEQEKAKPLELDLQDSIKSINIEYVSQEDYHNLGGEKSMSTAETIDMKKVARQVRNQLQADTKQGIYGVFYDPLFYNEDYEKMLYEEIKSNEIVSYRKKISSGTLTEEERILFEDKMNFRRKKALEPAIELLRQQVQDFANWLKEQKAI
jgi:hypothetical protein